MEPLSEAEAAQLLRAMVWWNQIESKEGKEDCWRWSWFWSWWCWCWWWCWWWWWVGVGVLVFCNDGFVDDEILVGTSNLQKTAACGSDEFHGWNDGPPFQMQCFSQTWKLRSNTEWITKWKVHQVHHEMHMPMYTTLCPAFQGFAEREQDNSPTSYVPRAVQFTPWDTDTVHTFGGLGPELGRSSSQRRSLKL